MPVPNVLATTPPRPAATLLAAPKRPTLAGVATGTGAMVCVGGSVAVSSVLAHAPVFTAEALRYAMACVILLVLARLTGRRLVLPRGIEWLWLAGIAATGLVLFNVALVAGSRHAEPAVLGVAVACVPAVLAVIGPLLEGSRPRAAGVTAALVVTCGAALVQGLGRTDGLGVAWAAVVFACEAAFTLLAIPVLARHGPWGVSVHTTWVAAVVFAVIGLVHEGPGAAARLSTGDWLAVVYLAVAVTAVAFVMWYSSVGRLGASRAGLLTGVAPVAAAAVGVLLGAPAPQPLVWVGIAVVAVGLTLGLRQSRPHPRAPSTTAAPKTSLTGGSLRLSWWIRLLRLIACAGAALIHHESRINRGKPAATTSPTALATGAPPERTPCTSSIRRSSGGTSRPWSQASCTSRASPPPQAARPVEPSTATRPSPSRAWPP
jgi:drug/metabolite transporter (DMT)-like permease